MLVSVQQVTKSFKDDIVLKDVSLAVETGDRIGLLGPNGAGKTTLLNMIAGSIQPDEGAILRQKGLEIGYLRQNDALVGSRTLEQEARDAFEKVYALQKEMEATAAQLAKVPDDARLLQQYDALQAAFEAKDGYHLDDKINRVLNGLGFGGVDRQKTVDTLSGGEKMRFGFAKLLLRQPDLLMLDEPTNHLDFTMLAWLEDYLAQYKGAVLVVSHDRYFLDAVAKDICEVERHVLTRYSGGYTSFVVQKEERRRAQQRAYDKQQAEIAHMEDYVRRNLVRASTTKMAQSRQKALERMERVEKPAPKGKSISMRYDYDVEPFETVLTVQNLGASVGEADEKRRLFGGLQLVVKRGEKLALVGPNGVGKSTFLKAIQAMVPHEGTARWGGNVRLGYFDQELAGLTMDETVLEAVHSQYPAKTEFELRSLLGRLLLEGETVYKKVRELSGAMRAKVAFAILQLRRANVLVMDEPTNHLDYAAKEVLETALREYTGTLLVVSHDRYFLRRVPSAILELGEEGFERYEGNYDDYREEKQARQPVAAAAAATPRDGGEERPAQGGYRTKQQRVQAAQLRQALAAAEQRVQQLEEEIEQLNAQLALPENSGNYELLAQCSQSLEEKNTELEQAMEEWVGLTEQQNSLS